MSELMEAVQDLEGRLPADQLHLLATLLKGLDYIDPVHGPVFRVKFQDDRTAAEQARAKAEIARELGFPCDYWLQVARMANNYPDLSLEAVRQMVQGFQEYKDGNLYPLSLDELDQ